MQTLTSLVRSPDCVDPALNRFNSVRDLHDQLVLVSPSLDHHGRDVSLQAGGSFRWVLNVSVLVFRKIDLPRINAARSRRRRPARTIAGAWIRAWPDGRGGIPTMPCMAMHFDLVDLRLMVHIADANSMTRGAELSFISLPAASTRIKNLEENIGTKLLYRTSAGVTLTPPGQAFVMHARTVLGQLEHLRGDMQEYVRGIKGHVRVFANTTSLGEFLPPVLRQFLRLHPDVNIDRRDRLVLVVPRGHALQKRRHIEFADTLEFDHVGLNEASALHAFLRQASDQLHRPIRLRIQVGNFETACRMIESGVGVGVLPESAADRHAQSMAIVLVPLTDAWSVREMQICLRSLEALPSFAQELVQLLVVDAQRQPKPD